MGRVNPWLLAKLPEAAKRASPLRYVIEVRPDVREGVKANLLLLPQLSVISQPADRFIMVEAPPELLPQIDAIPGVVKINAETLYWEKSPLFGPPAQVDPYLGEVKVSPVEIPVSPMEALIKAPFRALALRDVIVYTTEKQRAYIEAPEDNKIKVICAVADTGLTIPHFLFHPNSRVYLISKVPFEVAYNGQSHGTWCSTAAFGDDWIHPLWGRCQGVADPDEMIHIKVLSNMGFGMTSWILDGIYEAWKQGAKVLSMSLGGPLQGSPIDDDPACRLITALKGEMITVVAAGNDGVDWSIGSPGACPDALTVGAWSMTDNALSWFSSRGPSGEFYRDNPDIWRRDLDRRGEDMIKPDLCCPGGGRRDAEEKDEQILSGASGWYDLFADPLLGWGCMKGTSMATPACAGLVALLLSRGLIASAADVKRVMAKQQPKNPNDGLGLIKWSLFT